MKISKYVDRPITLMKIFKKMVELAEKVDFYFDVNVHIDDLEYEKIMKIMETDYHDERHHIDTCIYLQIGELIKGKEITLEESVNCRYLRSAVNHFIYMLGEILRSLDKNHFHIGDYNNLRVDNYMFFHKLMYVYLIEYNGNRELKSARNV